ncbi:serine/threonine-protein kinase prp4-like isoform X15 [Nymphaea colorata]|nr:serine/threonine-protein kinase prp4-like isoform X16 [Nymphaea colorata]XP_049936223.1 serine/threonine-protein kinase prp4-like isoform X14 [Nymphaea colorata]XP_049936224.1 serine/threonine-protein kinase prp4-like isoform X15 [Nymphaea colorata]XP_049936225.1 serine/threonine-protein kinase prp4-like isoform X15 [Nymphaea colorata]XP_049936226.1 serine/threonine-protein kinase prp4-like isoform X15 [Nymphaea colorata]
MILYQNVNEAKNVLKLCNFGNAMFAGKNDTIVVSLFILGLPYDHALDIWSVGCCLYELYTGKVLFPGPSNNDMLRLHMELKGPFHKKMLRKGAFTDHHFDQDLNFHATEEDPVTKKVNLLFAINVAEEGLDIQTCCLIICFDLPSTVASYIQSKGRAHM